MRPITVVLSKDQVYACDRMVAGNQGLILYLTHDRVLFLPTSEAASRSVREEAESGKVVRIEYTGTPVWLS